MIYKVIITLQTNTSFVKVDEWFLLDCCRKMKVCENTRGRELGHLTPMNEERYDYSRNIYLKEV